MNMVATASIHRGEKSKVVPGIHVAEKHHNRRLGGLKFSSLAGVGGSTSIALGRVSKPNSMTIHYKGLAYQK